MPSNESRNSASGSAPIRVGLVGAGEVTQVIHLPTLLLLPHNYQVTAICDVSQEAIEHVQKKFKVPKAFLQSSELVKQDDVDLVMVVNSDEYHASCAIEAADAGKHVFIEKPMAMTRKDAEDIEAARLRNNVHIFIGYMRRYAPAFAVFRKLVEDSGPIRHCIVKDIIGPNSHFVGQSGTYPEKFFRDIPTHLVEERAALAQAIVKTALGPKKGASKRLNDVYRLLGSLGSHDLSLMRETLGGVPSRCLSAFATDDGLFITAQLEYENGPAQQKTHPTEEGAPSSSTFVATYTTGIHNVGVFDASIEVFCSDRVLRIDYDTPYVKGLPITISVKENDLSNPGSFSEKIIRPTYKDAYTQQFEDIFAAIREGHGLKTTPKDAMQDLTIFEMIMQKI